MTPIAKAKIVPWFERKFDFSTPVEQVPTVCIRLRGTPARLEDLLRQADDFMLRTREDGTWSILENVGHLLDLEGLWIARVYDFSAGKSQLTPTDLENRQTDRAQYNAQTAELVLKSFRDARLRLLSTLAETPESAYQSSILHPRLKVPMRLIDHLLFVAEHDDHHLARIWDLMGGVRNEL